MALDFLKSCRDDGTLEQQHQQSRQDEHDKEAPEQKERSWVEWIKQQIRGGSEEEGYERGRGRSLPDEQREQQKEERGRGR